MSTIEVALDSCRARFGQRPLIFFDVKRIRRRMLPIIPEPLLPEDAQAKMRRERDIVPPEFREHPRIEWVAQVHDLPVAFLKRDGQPVVWGCVEPPQANSKRTPAS